MNNNEDDIIETTPRGQTIAALIGIAVGFILLIIYNQWN